VVSTPPGAARADRASGPALAVQPLPRVGDLVPADADQPGRERSAVGPETRAAGPGRDEGLLRDVLGVRPRPERAHGHAVHLPGEPFVGPGQGLLVALGEPLGDLVVVRSGGPALGGGHHPPDRIGHGTGSATTTTLLA
jgi:hypothetical protein